MNHGPIGIILAAGASSRMGVHKALLLLDGVPMVTVHVNALRAVCERVIVVLGSQAEAITPHLPPGTEVCINRDWAVSHMSDSLALALQHETGTVLVTPIDVPAAPHRVLKDLLKATAPAVLHHNNEPGHPVAFSAMAVRDKLRQGHLREALACANPVHSDWPGCTRSWNTPEEWADWVK